MRKPAEYSSRYTTVSGNEQRLYRFPNGYGASVIQGPYSYGGPLGFWELAVLHKGELDYTTPITNNVEGWLSEDAVDALLSRIEALPPKEEGT